MCTVETLLTTAVGKPIPCGIHTARTHPRDTPNTLLFGERKEGKGYYSGVQEKESTKIQPAVVL